MKKPLALAALAAMILVGAAYPEFDKPDADDAAYTERDDRDHQVERDDQDERDDHDQDERDYAARDESAPPRTYRPCRSRSDDQCIQLYERGVRASYARWLDYGDPDYQPVRVASAEHRGHRAHRAHGGAHRWHHSRHAWHAAPRHHGRRMAQARPHSRHAAPARPHRGQLAQTRPQRRAAQAAARVRCAPAVRRPARVARAAPAAVPRRAAAATPARERAREGAGTVRGM